MKDFRCGWVLSWMVATLVHAAEFDVRVIAASTGPPKIHPSLRDVEPLLRRHLNFQQFELVDRGSIRLPSNGQPLRLDQGKLVVRCTGQEERLSLTIEQNGRTIVQTQISLRRGHPLIFSGLPDSRGTLLITLVLR